MPPPCVSAGVTLGGPGTVVRPSEYLDEVLLVSQRHFSTTSQGTVGITVYDDSETRIVVDLWCFGSALGHILGSPRLVFLLGLLGSARDTLGSTSDRLYFLVGGIHWSQCRPRFI